MQGPFLGQGLFGLLQLYAIGVVEVQTILPPGASAACDAAYMTSRLALYWVAFTNCAAQQSWMPNYVTQREMSGERRSRNSQVI